VPDDFVLSDKNIRQVQARLPNRNGKTTAHAMWPGTELGRVAQARREGVACMKRLRRRSQKIAQLPDRTPGNAHGNLAEQNRLVGPQRGIDTAPAAGKASEPAPAAAIEGARRAAAEEQLPGLPRQAQKLVGPALADIAKKPRRARPITCRKDQGRQHWRLGRHSDAAADRLPTTKPRPSRSGCGKPRP
jgi:hypothetical protein